MQRLKKVMRQLSEVDLPHAKNDFNVKTAGKCATTINNTLTKGTAV